jgi:hypothetical protein
MYEQVFVWVGLALLLVLCLPFAGLGKLVLTVYAGVLRLALLALLGGAAYLWFRPEHLPAEVSVTLNQSPWLRALLPAPGTQNFAIGAAALVVAVLLPWLVVLDVCRKSAGERQRRLRVRSTEPGATEPVLLSPAPQRGPSPALRRIDGRAAADTMAEAASRKPSRAVNRLEQ